jgi:hypothetical protein
MSDLERERLSADDLDARVDELEAENERLKSRILALESQGAVNVVARPLKRERDDARRELDRYRKFVEDIADGWVGNLQNRAQRVLHDRSR